MVKPVGRFGYVTLSEDGNRPANSGRRTWMSAALSVALAVAVPVSASPASAEKLTIWSGWPDLAPFYKRVGDQLKSKYPDLEVSVEAIALREHEKRLALSLPSGAAGDVIEMEVEAARYLEAGVIPEPPASIVDFVKTNYDMTRVKTAMYDGKIFGVPLFQGQGALFYDYTAYAQKLAQRDASGALQVSGWSLRLSGGGSGIAEKYWTILYNHGGTLLEEKNGKWRAAYASEAGRTALKQYLDNVVVYRTVTPEMKADAEAFELGQTAMFIRESWVIGDVAKKAPNLKYATAPLPKGTLMVPVDLDPKARSPGISFKRQASRKICSGCSRTPPGSPTARASTTPQSSRKSRSSVHSSTSRLTTLSSRFRRLVLRAKSSPDLRHDWRERSPTNRWQATTPRSMLS